MVGRKGNQLWGVEELPPCASSSIEIAVEVMAPLNLVSAQNGSGARSDKARRGRDASSDSNRWQSSDTWTWWSARHPGCWFPGKSSANKSWGKRLTKARSASGDSISPGFIFCWEWNWKMPVFLEEPCSKARTFHPESTGIGHRQKHCDKMYNKEVLACVSFEASNIPF